MSNLSETTSSGIKVRCLVQQCLSAKLQTKLADPAKNIEPEFAQVEHFKKKSYEVLTWFKFKAFLKIERGVVFFVCFMKDAQETDVDKLVKSVLNVKLSELDDGKYTSVLDLPGSVLVIPQACLGGKMKGKLIQYHANINKEQGEILYEKFVTLCRKYTNESDKWRETEGLRVECGTYGIRQVYSTQTNGPFLHLVEF